MDHYHRSAQNWFSASQIDRRTERRHDQDWLQSQHDAVNSAFILIHQRCCLLNVEATALLQLPCAIDNIQTCYLGSHAGHALFAQTLSAELANQHAAHHSGRWLDLRTIATTLSADEAAICAYAVAIANWQQQHRYCGCCGSANLIQHGGHRMTCSNAACGHITFPRIDPAMITLVQHEDAILLGRQHSWPERRYSTLAGFVEPGESIEDAVHREVQEEAGILLQEIHYHSSQPWPFPASLMLGFRACAASTRIVLGAELQDARWWRLSEFKQSVRNGDLLLSMPQSIAFALIRDWYQEQTGQALLELVHK